MKKSQPSMSQLLNATHISYADDLGEEEGGFCLECQSRIPDATIGQVNRSTFFVQSQITGEVVLLNPSRINKRNIDAIETRLMALGAGYCIDCRAPHPLSNMAKVDDDAATTTEDVLAPLT